MPHFADRLIDAVRRKGNPLCVGLDPRFDALPIAWQRRYGPDGIAPAFEAFSLHVLELIHTIAPVVKPQAAFFELAGPEGLAGLQRVLARAREMELLTILDAKRGDIASTATAYAEAAFGDKVWAADSLTVNPYLGADAVEPFISIARQNECGVFVLVRTSNPGGGLFQNLVCDTEPLYRHVGRAVASWNEANLGDGGYGDVGAVVGATQPNELVELRALMPNVWFLVPGYGAQGGTAAAVRAAYATDGLGAVVNSSRGITFPFHPTDPDWEQKIVAAATRAAEELR